MQRLIAYAETYENKVRIMVLACGLSTLVILILALTESSLDKKIILLPPVLAAGLISKTGPVGREKLALSASLSLIKPTLYIGILSVSIGMLIGYLEAGNPALGRIAMLVIALPMAFAIALFTAIGTCAVYRLSPKEE